MPQEQTIIFEICLYSGLLFVITSMALLTRGRDALNWSKDLKTSALVNIGLLKFNALVTTTFVVLYEVGPKYYESLNLPEVSIDFWIELPFVVTCLILLLVYDITLYWVHRALHMKWLWPTHAVHHSDTELHFLSWSRGHFLEQSVIASGIFLTSAWLGLEIEDVVLLYFIKGIHQYYAHSNIDWDHGRFKLLLVSPQFHRWHHADDIAAHNKNFASIFPFLDKVFGTYYYPHTAVNVPTGFEGTPRNNFMELAFYPFIQWRRMIKEHFANSAVLSDETPPSIPGS